MSFATVLRTIGRGAVRRAEPDLEDRLANRARASMADYRDSERLKMAREREGLTLEQMREHAKIERVKRAEEERINRLREQKLQGEVMSMATPEELRAGREAETARTLAQAAYYKSGGGRANPGAIGPTVTLYDDQGMPIVYDRRTGQPIGKGKPPSDPAVMGVPRSEYEGAWQRAKKSIRGELTRKLFGFTTRDGLTEGSPEYNDRMRELLLQELRNSGWSPEAIRKSGVELGSPDRPIKLD